MREFIIKLLTLINSGAVGITYWQSVIHFLWHNGWLDHPLTEGDSEWEKAVLGVGAAMCGLVGWSNQIGMVTPVGKFIKHIFRTDDTISRDERGRISNVVIFAGSVSKAVISSSSLLSTIRDYYKIELGFPISCAAIAVFGNFAATCVVLMKEGKDAEDKPYRGDLPPRRAHQLGLAVAIIYAATQGALYSNAIFNAITKMRGSRPGLGDSDWIGDLIFVSTLYPSVAFMEATGRAFYRMTRDVVGRAIDHSPRQPPSRYQRWTGAVGSLYRTIALLLAVFEFIYSVSDENPLAACLVTLLCSLAAPGVFAILYPVTEELGEEEKESVPMRYSLMPSPFEPRLMSGSGEPQFLSINSESSLSPQASA